MELRENGHLEYKLPEDALGFIEILKNGVIYKFTPNDRLVLK